MEEGYNTMTKKKKDKKTTIENKLQRTLLKRGELRHSGEIGSFCSTSGYSAYTLLLKFSKDVTNVQV